MSLELLDSGLTRGVQIGLYRLYSLPTIRDHLDKWRIYHIPQLLWTYPRNQVAATRSKEQRLFSMAHLFVSNSNLLHRSFAQRPEKAISASGVSIFLESGREVLDASVGPAVSCLGFGRPEITKVVANQMNQLSYLYSGSRFTCDAMEDLAYAFGETPRWFI